MAVLPVGHARAGQGALSVADLRNEPFVHYPRSAGERAWGKPFSLCEAHGFRPEVAQEASHWLTILSLVGAGLGVCIAPACVARLAPPEVVCLPLPDEQLTSDIGLMCRVGEQRPLVEGFARVAFETVVLP